jgi:hypothetical protein
MITIQTTITIQDITRALASDWGPTLHHWTGAIAAVLAVPYVAGLLAGEAWYRLRAWVSSHHMHGLARMGLPGGDPNLHSLPYVVITSPVTPTTVIPRTLRSRLMLEPIKIETCYGCDPVAQPRVSAIHFMAAGGMSQRQIARSLQISRHRVKSELAS